MKPRKSVSSVLDASAILAADRIWQSGSFGVTIVLIRQSESFEIYLDATILTSTLISEIQFLL